MKLFGRKSAGRASARPVHTRVPIGTLINAPVLGEWPRSYEAQVRDGYLNNAVAQRAVRMVAEGVAAAPVTASDPRGLALVRATSGGQALLETVAIHLLLHGNAYVELLAGPDGAPCELYALRPERVTVEADARGWPAAFLYRAGQVSMRIAADSIIHIRTHHPLDDHYGLGCLGAASGAVSIHNAAAKWNKALLDNAARPSGALVCDAAEAMSADQFERLKAELDGGFAGSANAGRPMLLEGGLKWQPLSMTPADMDFVGLKASAAREIALAFGVPPMLLGLPGDATYANYREANKALWRLSILPLAGKILDAVAEGLQPWFAGLSLSVDLDQVTALSEDRERLWAQVSAADFLTPAEKRAYVGLAPLHVADGKAPMVEMTEVKFNPNHDLKNGQFTFSGTGQNFGGGGASADAPPYLKPKPTTGRFGGGGASGSWDKPERVKLTPAMQQPNREVVKPSPLKPSVIKQAVIPAPKRPTPFRKVSAGGYDFDIDPADRTVRVSGDLRLVSAQPRSRTAQSNAGKPDRLVSDHGGHFIAREFGGPETRYNHFAQDARFNKSDYRKMELNWRGLLRQGQRVRVDIKAKYDGGSKRPSEVLVTYYTSGMRYFKPFLNKKKGN